MADGVIISTEVGFDGNAYTTSVSNDELTNDDFLLLMLEEMKQQDPTDPMDSQALMDSTLQMSSIQANEDMSAAMKSLEASYASTAISNAANMLGHIVEDGSMNSDGLLRSYKVETVENRDGEIYLNTREMVGITDGLLNNDTEELVLYDADGIIYEDGEPTDYKVSLDNDGRFEYNEDGTLKLYDIDNNEVTDQEILDRYVYGGSSVVYSEDITTIALNDVDEVR